MRQLIELLSWTSGFVVVVAVSAVLALITGRLQPAALRWAACTLVPVAVSYCLYWSPVWLGADCSISEHSFLVWRLSVSLVARGRLGVSRSRSWRPSAPQG